MKSILMSIQPKWCELIASGKKTVEVRKTKPKTDEPFKVYIYCTKPSKKHQRICGSMVLNYDELYLHPTEGIKYGDSIEFRRCNNDYTEDNFLNGKVIGEFVCNEISAGYLIEPFGDFIQKRTCLTYDEISKYSNGKPLYSWRISDLVIYDKPKELSEFHKPCKCLDEYEGEVYCDCLNCEDAGDSDDGVLACDRTLKRPPQSYCYVEELKENE
ncbi:MAG: ASCH domain-containing protein [Oscillospiraceae bacterium]|nr:ASCH domain-containing protein [Oscillospiraceae bacterium]